MLNEVGLLTVFVTLAYLLWEDEDLYLAWKNKYNVELEGIEDEYRRAVFI